MIEFIREYCDLHYKNVIVPALPEILKSYFNNNQHEFDTFVKLKLDVYVLLSKAEEEIIKNNLNLKSAIIKVIQSNE